MTTTRRITSTTLSSTVSMGEAGRDEPSPRRNQPPVVRGKRPRPPESPSYRGSRDDGRLTVTAVDVLVRIPKHSSVLSHPWCRRRQPCLPQSEDHGGYGSSESGSGSNVFTLTPELNMELRCHHPGVLWKGLLPMIFASSEDNEQDDFDLSSSSGSKRNRCTATSTVPRRMLLGLGLEDALRRHSQAMMMHQNRQNSEVKNLPEDNTTDGDCTKGEFFYERLIRVPLELTPLRNNSTDNGMNSNSKCNTSKYSVVVWLFPPLLSPSDIDRTPFAKIASRIQTIAALQKGWNAWLSTLGGGYFSIKSLRHSLWLSRQQKAIAVWLGDARMAKQSTLHEAYNWMYAGRFQEAGSLLDQLEDELTGKYKSGNVTNNDDKKILQQCAPARVCLRRLKQLSRKGLGTYPSDDTEATSRTSRTHDDFQRFRIVSC